MSFTLFFSWQADRSRTTGRNLIEKALERAIGELQADIEVDEAVRDLKIDRDTKDVPGSPPIVDTILAKIDAASMFLPDLTFVGTRAGGRPTPNPNVLIEYGYALKSLGHDRMIPVMNTAYGEPRPETLPFDMIHLRHPITYHCPEGADEETRRAARIGLEGKLVEAIKAIVGSKEFKAALPQPPAPPAFPRRESKDGPGRFRASGEPLGVVDGMRGFSGTVVDLRLAAGSPTWLRLIPAVDPGTRWRWAELKQAGGVAVPLYAHASGFNYLRAEDGFGMFSIAGSEDVTDSITMVFDTGEIWSIDTYAIDAARDDYLPLREREFADALKRFAYVARTLSIEGPFRWIAGMSGVRGRRLSTPSGYELVGASVASDIVVEGGHQDGADPAASLEPFFDAVFEKCGVDRAQWIRALRARMPRQEVTTNYGAPKA